MQGVERQLGDLQEATGEDVELGNRYRLNELYERQQTDRARNVVQDLGRNFREAEDRKTSEVAGQQARFNTKWLDKSQLSNPKVAAAPDEGAKRLVPPSSGKPVAKKGKPAGTPPPAQFRAPVFEQDKAETKDRAAGRGPAGGVGGPATGDFGYGRADRKGDAVSRYKEEHMRQQAKQLSAD